jgi:hypothetical protein
MDGWVKALLIGGAGYLAYEYFFAPATTTAAPATATSTAVAAPAPAVAAPAAAPIQGQSLANLATAIQNAAASDSNLVNGMMSGDHWNYYANILTGKSIAKSWLTEDPITFATYWATASPVVASMTGLGSVMAGLGAVIMAHGGLYRALGDYIPMSTVPSADPNGWN